MGTLADIVAQFLVGLLLLVCCLIVLDRAHAFPIPSAPRIAKAAVPERDPDDEP
jgi:hypothetical protein